MSTPTLTKEQTLSKTEAEPKSHEKEEDLSLFINQKKVKLFDKDTENNLELYSYIKCRNEDSEKLKQYRGVIYHDKKMFLKSFPYVDEYNEKELNQVSDLVDNFNDYNFYESIEGAVLRLFYINDKWFLSTHKKLDAFKSRWGSSKTFGQLFTKALYNETKYNLNFLRGLTPITEEDILDVFTESLDKSKKYLFIVCNDEDNRIVCDTPDEKQVYHLATLDENNKFVDVTLDLPRPRPLEFKNLEEIENYLHTYKIFLTQGVLCINKHTNKHIKLFHTLYQHLSSIRGNQPSLEYRYLQLRNSPDLLKDLYHIYPKMAHTFDELEKNIFDKAKLIYKTYIDRFINKKYLVVSKPEYNILKILHSSYLQNRSDIISLNKVLTVINEQPTPVLQRLLKNVTTITTERLQPKK